MVIKKSKIGILNIGVGQGLSYFVIQDTIKDFAHYILLLDRTIRDNKILDKDIYSGLESLMGTLNRDRLIIDINYEFKIDLRGFSDIFGVYPDIRHYQINGNYIIQLEKKEVKKLEDEFYNLSERYMQLHSLIIREEGGK